MSDAPRAARSPGKATQARSRAPRSPTQALPRGASLLGLPLLAADYLRAADKGLRAPGALESSVDVLFAAVANDRGAVGRSGARSGPSALRAASYVGGSYSEALGVDVAEELSAADRGDIVTPEIDVEGMLDAVADHVAGVVRTGTVAGLVGGDGTLTLGALRGIRRTKKRPVGLLHVDAFHDLVHVPGRPALVNERSVLGKAIEEELLRAENVLSVGVRGPSPSAGEQRAALRNGFEVVSLDDVRWDVHSAVSQVRSLARRGSLYVSVDLCALDPSVAPGVSTPAPGGMSTWELQQILRALVGADIVAFDVVGLVPGHDVSELSAGAGVIVLRELLAAIADTRRSGAPDSSRLRGRSGRRSA